MWPEKQSKPGNPTLRSSRPRPSNWLRNWGQKRPPRSWELRIFRPWQRGVILLKDEGHPVKKCCQLLKLSASGFYSWRKRLPSKRSAKKALLKGQIKRVFEDSKATYGSPRIHKKLQRDGHVIGKNTVASLMAEDGLRARRKRGFRPKTTRNNPNDRKSARVFKIEDHRATRPNQFWASDLTYVPTDREGFVYLVTVMDLYNREIKGWNLSNSMEAENTKDALLEALMATSGPLGGLVFHSDQGAQYCADILRDKLSLLKITQSMSRKGNCYDNAFAESFFSSLKTELPRRKFSDLEDAKKEIFRYIEWYNRERLHSSLGYLSPLDYGRHNRHVA